MRIGMIGLGRMASNVVRRLQRGGDEAAVARHAPIFATITPGRGEIAWTPARVGSAEDGTAEEGWLHCAPSGAGHYVKMIHNGIEYGMMQAFALFASANDPKLAENRRCDLDRAAIAALWRRGSVVSSWLLDLTADALAKNPSLEGFSSEVQDSGEGRSTVEAAMSRRRRHCETTGTTRSRRPK